MTKIYQKAIVLALNPTLLCGLGRGVEVTPISDGLANKLIQRESGYTKIFIGGVTDQVLLNQAELLSKDYKSIMINPTVASFLLPLFNEDPCIEMLYLDGTNAFIITVL